MTITNDQIEDMVNELHRFNAQEVIYRFGIEKSGEQFIFEMKLSRKGDEDEE